MHRQSLGSPGSKLLHPHGVIIVGGRDDSSAVVTVAADSQKIMLMKDQAASPSLLEDEQVRKSIKSLNKSLSRAEKYIHLIPLLTFLCFLILYLFSHIPSDKDLAQFHGFEGFAKPIESANIDDELQRVLESDVLPIRSISNLQEIDRQDPKHRLHRKLADF
ncbi:uncharacterized protein LOC107819063 [Nicotiana tabacum]|uniref:Uncharacterized protein LOC107819063 n=2 Tax=Nicotiana TaxID=4085 RepID=A0A1S4CHE2_TOBAC|nr:PREDICTED: uncharacterized protein LOC104215447 [Nicotiana sylvestris]XP_016500622.1 PREDICTED: uncharacterized protein LOC107819063 [Nicotiana tabacum]